LAIDLFCGLGGWTEGLLAEGYTVVGFDNERHCYGEAQYPAQLVIQDVLTLHGRQFKSAALIVASPPCQAYSYRAMPWKRAKALPPPSNELFDACFRIQREACEATRRTCRACGGEAVTRGLCRCEVCDGKGWRKDVSRIAKSAHRGKPFAGAVRIVAAFYLPRPKALKGDKPHVTRPDGDKLLRGILDALTGILYLDDSQVTQVKGSKFYAGVGESPRADIAITAL
jgi:Holliday junction resolvase RusA-like endonuclease